MPRQPLKKLVSRTLVLPQANIDTDQIIPARFLTVTSRDGLGRCAFADWRAKGAPEGAPLEAPGAKECQVLVAGPNFGCGSSREHAVWALADFGFSAVISSKLADIFRRNALGNGLLAFEVDPETHRQLLEAPGVAVEIDLERAVLSFGGREVPFPIEGFARHCLLEGVDELEYLLAQQNEIQAHENRYPLPELRLEELAR